MKFVAISDTHIGGGFNEKMFLKGVDYINKCDADYFLFSGDLTDQGTLAEYELATTKYLPMIKKDLLLVPGNHDVKNVGDLLWEEYIGPRYFVVSNEEHKVKLLGLDSNEPDMNTGRMGRKAIDRIYEEFMDLPDDWLKVLVFHHQSLPIKYTGRERSALIDAGNTIKAITDCNITLVVNGHRHISNVYELTDGDKTSLVVNCGTMSCKKTRYKEEYSVTEIEIDPITKKARVDVILLNNEGLKVITKFDGIIKELDPPKVEQNRLATIVQIGNTDFSNEEFILENYSHASQIINNLESCDLVIHQGDITAHSYIDEFRLASSLLAHIHQPLVVIPGPRDNYPLGSKLFTKYFGEKNKIFKHDNMKVLAFNTCILEEKIGRLGRSRLLQVKEELVGIPEISVVAFHHTIIPLPRTKHESELQDAGDVLAFFVENNLNLVLTGAKNTSGCWQVNKTVFVNVGTVSSKNITSPEGNSFNIIQIFKTDKGKYYKIDEVFVETGEITPLGRLHVEN